MDAPALGYSITENSSEENSVEQVKKKKRIKNKLTVENNLD